MCMGLGFFGIVVVYLTIPLNQDDCCAHNVQPKPYWTPSLINSDFQLTCSSHILICLIICSNDFSFRKSFQQNYNEHSNLLLNLPQASSMTLVDEGVVKVDAAQTAGLMPMHVINEKVNHTWIFFGYLQMGR